MFKKTLALESYVRRRQFVFEGGLVGLLYLSGCKNLFRPEQRSPSMDSAQKNPPTQPPAQSIKSDRFKIYPENIPAIATRSAQDQLTYYINLWDPWINELIQKDYTRVQERIPTTKSKSIELRLQPDLILPGTFRKLGGMYYPSTKSIFISDPTVIHHEISHALWDPANNILFGDRYQGIPRRQWEDLLEQRRKDPEWAEIMQKCVEQQSQQEQLQILVAMMNSFQEDYLELCRAGDCAKGTIIGENICDFISNDFTHLLLKQLEDARNVYARIPFSKNWEVSQKSLLLSVGDIVKNLYVHTDLRESLRLLLGGTEVPLWIKYAKEYVEKGQSGYERMVREWLLSDDEIHARLVQSLFDCRIRCIDDSKYPLTDAELYSFRQAKFKTTQGNWEPMFLNPTIRYAVARRKPAVADALPHATMIFEGDSAIELSLNGFQVLGEIPVIN